MAEHINMTSGSARREPRTLDDAVVYEDLAASISRLRTESSRGSAGAESAITLVHRPHLRIVASELAAGGVIEERGTKEEYVILVLAGSVVVDTADYAGPANAPALLSVASGRPWRITAERAASVVLVVVESGVPATGGIAPTGGSGAPATRRIAPTGGSGARA